MKTNLGKLLDTIGTPTVAITLSIIGLFACTRTPKVEALRFNPDVKGYSINIPFPQEEPYWELSGYDTEYKNAILRDFQDMLTKEGIPRAEQRWYVGMLYHENGTLDPTRFGDYVKGGKWCTKNLKGCRPLSFGIIQRNTMSAFNQYADTWLSKNPEWKSAHVQLEWVTEQIVARRKIYGSPRLVVLGHNCPACSQKGAYDSKAGYVSKVQRDMAALSLSDL